MPLPALLVAAAFVVLVAWAVTAERKRSARRARLLSARGFQPVAHPAPEDAERLLALFRRGRLRGRRLALRRVARGESWSGPLYAFEVLDPGSRRPQVAGLAVGCVLPGARLPAFELWARYEGAPLGKLLLDRMGERMGHGQPVALDDVEGFARRFTVVACEEGGAEAVRAFLTPELRRQLADLHLQCMALLAGGEAVVLQGNPYAPGQRGDEAAMLGRLLDEAEWVRKPLAPG